MTMTFDPASLRAWHAQLTEIRRPPGARGIAAMALAWAAYALIWLLALGVVVGIPAALLLATLRLAIG